jgi:carbamoyltransferase
MDYLVLGSYLLSKPDQPAWTEDERWEEDFVLD